MTACTDQHAQQLVVVADCRFHVRMLAATGFAESTKNLHNASQQGLRLCQPVRGHEQCS